MALGSGFQVSASALNTHANVATQVAEQLGKALVNGQAAALGDKAFGQIAVSLAFSQLLKSVAGPAVSVLMQAQSTWTTISKDVTMVANNYTGTDQTSAKTFQLIGSGGTPTTTGTGGAGTAGTAAKRSGNIVTDVSSLEKDISSGNWMQASLAGMSMVSDVANILSNPVNAVMQYGLNFLVQHVKPLQEAVSWLVGNPGQVTSFGNSWNGVSQSVTQAGSTFGSSVTRTTANWTGQASANYQCYATDQINGLQATATATSALGSVTQSIGTLVQNVSTMIKNMVSQAMSQIIQTALAASFMITIPVVVAQVVNEVISWMQKLATVIKNLTSCFSTLQPLLTNLVGLYGSIQKLLAGGSKSATAISPTAVPTLAHV